MDPRDRKRLDSNREKVLRHLQQFGVASNVQLRDIGGLRAMGRVHELQDDYDITVTRKQGGIWEVRYHGPRQPGQQSLFR